MQVVEESGLTRRRLLQARAAGARAARSASRCSTPLASLGPGDRPRPLLHDALAARHAGSSTSTAGRTARPTSRRTTSTPPSPRARTRRRSPSSLVLVRLPTERARPAARSSPATDADGIVAYSKICTHAGCAISLYRAPLFQPDEPTPALVCPCHYSTFDPATGGTVTFGPAGRKLPMLPLHDRPERRAPRARATSTSPVGPSWWGVRERKPTNVIRGLVRFVDQRSGTRAVPAQDAALPLPGPLVVPARRGRALLVHRPRRDGHLPDALLRGQHREGRLPRAVRAAAGAGDDPGLPLGARHLDDREGRAS